MSDDFVVGDAGLFPDAEPVTYWGDDGWLEARRNGLGASEVASALGLPGAYATPWQIWADKTRRRLPPDIGANPAVKLGNDLEPWLIEQSEQFTGRRAFRTPAQLYRNRGRQWMLASPDAYCRPASSAPPFPPDDFELVEAKTGGLVEPWGADEWSTELPPLRYEVQARCQLAVLGLRTRTWIVGLIAGFGLHAWPVEWDEEAEKDLMNMAWAWWSRHVIDGEEPALAAGDNAVMDAVHTGRPGIVDLPTAAAAAVRDYREARAKMRRATDEKKRAAAEIKRGLAGHELGRNAAGQIVVSWRMNRHGTRTLRVNGTD